MMVKPIEKQTTGTRKQKFLLSHFCCLLSRGVLSLWLLMCGIISPCPLHAAPSHEFPEYQLKAAFLYNFAKFVTWPTNAFESDDSALTIGIVGDDPFGPLLPTTLAGKTVNNRKLIIQHFNRDDTITGCQLLFISRSEKDRIPAILSSLKGKSILLVSETDQFAQRGGMINLLVVGQSVRFEINPDVIEKAGLKVSSKLGGLGIVIKSEEPSKNRS